MRYSGMRSVELQRKSIPIFSFTAIKNDWAWSDWTAPILLLDSGLLGAPQRSS
jgi:hypothetical protein